MFCEIDKVRCGDGVTKVKVDDPVVVEPILRCGECDACKLGKYNLCDLLVFMVCPGAAEVSQSIQWLMRTWSIKCPRGLSYEQGALVEPAAVAETVPRYLQLNQLHQLRELVEGNVQERAVIEVLFSTGIRMGEFAAMKKEIHIPNGKRKKGRIVLFTRECEEHLKAYLHWAKVLGTLL